MNRCRKFTPVPIKKNAAGDMRRVGFEMEYSGLNLEETSDLIVSLFGGELVRQNAFCRIVKDTAIGTVVMELDMPLLKNEMYKTYLEALGIALDARQMASVEQLLNGAASAVVPYEVALPPLPLSGLYPVEQLRKKMFDAGAKGTRASVTYAFGLHINPEVPVLDVEALRRYLQAFLLLEGWIREKSQIDWTRRLMPFVNGFPKAYQKHVLKTAYQPNWETFLADYLMYNKTRYRALDLLPVFAWIDKAGVRELFPDISKIGARPAFHYRLPNCLIGDMSWCVADEWHYWAVVERLANDGEELHKLLWAFEVSERMFGDYRAKFVRKVDV